MNTAKRSYQIQTAMSNAKETQRQYDALSSPSTQRVRNPFPMWLLVMNTLPLLPAPSDKVTLKRKVHTTANGKRFVKEITLTLEARDLLPAKAWHNQGMSTEKVISELQRQGYIVNPQTVRMTLSNLRHAGCFALRNPRGKTSSKLYFCRQDTSTLLG